MVLQIGIQIANNSTLKSMGLPQIYRFVLKDNIEDNIHTKWCYKTVLILTVMKMTWFILFCLSGVQSREN